MVAAPSSPVARGTAMDAVLASKGIKTLDDLDGPDGPEPLLELQAHHELIFLVEHCHAQRPSKLGSLKGSHEKYVDEFSRLEQTVESLRGGGAVSVIKWEPGMPAVPVSSRFPSEPTGGRRSRPQSAGAARPHISRPQSASASSQNPRLRALGLNSEERTESRIGSFEVSFKLVNTQSGKQYGPIEVFSKIQSQCWFATNILLKRVQDRLQEFLQHDLGAGMLFQHAQSLAKEAKDDERPRTVLQQAENLPDPDPPASSA